MPIPRRLADYRRLARVYTHSRRGRSILAFALGQLVVVVASFARVPLIVDQLHATGYGLVVACTTPLPWEALVFGSLTAAIRPRAAELLAVGQPQAALELVRSGLRRARQLAWAVSGVALVMSLAVPWPDALHVAGVEGRLTLALAILVPQLLLSASASGAVYTGLLHSANRVALTNLFPGVAAVFSFLATYLAWVADGSLVAFTAASGVATAAFYWCSWLFGRRLQRELARSAPADSAPAPATSAASLDFGQLFVMVGATAPPLLSTGLDALILASASGPAAAGAYGLASRLAIVIAIVPSALYPLLWTRFAQLHVRGTEAELRHEVRRDIVQVSGLTLVGALAFLALAPTAAHLLSGGEIQPPWELYLLMAALGMAASLQTVLLPAVVREGTSRYVATWVWALTPVNWVLSYALSTWVGVTGPAVASLAVAALQIALWFGVLSRTGASRMAGAQR